ncbi:anthranilate synthase component I family protein [Paenibacillus methanolicus]|uniref:Para-aminobenzoate synthetase component 1 n=1 Tax=Paenibacillus methanolicus TaxID=582686 RepID=A0A5S5BLS5_9BACL|nr:anthranilate synthase component I family protein [Paenibacillus methanolicus]TYP68027.1 para-aminobenzoate synthetase component 1 [Paenibacillus methanolicus]
MTVTSYEEWRGWRKAGYETLPVVYAWPLPEGESGRPDSWERAWQAASSYAFVLESGKDGRYTYLGLNPSSVIRGKGEQAESTDLLTGVKQTWTASPLAAVRQWMQPYRSPRRANSPKWTGGCVGFWSYDVIRTIERLPELAADDLGLPDYVFLRMNELWVVDHQARTLYCAVHADNCSADEAELEARYRAARGQAERMFGLWQMLTGIGAAEQSESARLIEKRKAREAFIGADTPHIDVEAMEGLTSPFRKEAFEAAVERIQAYIGQGDVFQVNLSQRQSMRTDAAPEDLYEWLRLVNPSPYMGMLRCPDFQLVSGSPELLVELVDGKLATRPIAGTRRRGRTEEEDRRMADELLSNEKERAEHIMLVDLERNDLGRIAAYGTVRVEELMVIEYYSHVMHLVSQVEGVLAEGRDAYDVIAATFPGGTITGAPKIRTMEIIEELEPTRRGPYTGSMGWIDYNGDMEFNIIIRTMAVKDGSVHIQAGAGIVIDSVPEREYYESLSKAKALWKAVEYSQRWARRDGHFKGGEAHDFGHRQL